MALRRALKMTMHSRIMLKRAFGLDLRQNRKPRSAVVVAMMEIQRLEDETHDFHHRHLTQNVPIEGIEYVRRAARPIGEPLKGATTALGLDVSSVHQRHVAFAIHQYHGTVIA